MNQTPLLFIANVTIEQKILQIFQRTFGSLNVENLKIELKQVPVSLFNIFLDVMETGKWIYKPEKSNRVDILSHNILDSIEVDCYDLSRAFIKILLRLGFKPADVFEKVYPYRMSKKNQMVYEGVHGKFECFYEAELKQIQKEENCFFFDNHAVAVAIVNKVKYYFDLTFKCYYDDEDAIFDTTVRGKIFSAAAGNELEKLKHLLEMHPDFNINNIDNKGQTLLHWAIIHKNLEMASFLINKGINANIPNKDNQIPLQTISNPDSELFLLLEKITKPESLKTHLETYTVSSIMLKGFSAIRNNDVTLLKKLMRPNRGCNVNAEDENGWTLLHWAAYYNRLECAEYLLSLNANPNVTNGLNLYPIQLIADSNLALFKLLAQYSPTITAQNILKYNQQKSNRSKNPKR